MFWRMADGVIDMGRGYIYGIVLAVLMTVIDVYGQNGVAFSNLVEKVKASTTKVSGNSSRS